MRVTGGPRVTIPQQPNGESRGTENAHANP
jgi:hypothetical protein